MRVPLEVEKQIEREKIAAYVVGHLPIIKSYAVKIGFVEIINDLIPSQMDVNPGTIFLGLVMDTLSGSTPLYRLDEFFQDQDPELLLGKRISPAAFNDYKECLRVIKDAIEKDQWQDLGVLSVTKPTVKRPAAHYKAYESEVELLGKKYRAVVIHSSAHDKRRQKRIGRELKADIGDNRQLNKPFTEKQMEYLVSRKVDPNAFIKPGAG
jgi:hypothetical protein